LPDTGAEKADEEVRRMPMLKRAATTGLAVTLALAGGAACSDEDGDGGTTDEEIQDLEDTGEDVQDEVDEEIDSQDQGTNEDGE
jgi:hypothetical protein